MTKSPRDVCTVARYFLLVSIEFGGGVLRLAIGNHPHSRLSYLTGSLAPNPSSPARPSASTALTSSAVGTPAVAARPPPPRGPREKPKATQPPLIPQNRPRTPFGG